MCVCVCSIHSVCKQTSGVTDRNLMETIYSLLKIQPQLHFARRCIESRALFFPPAELEQDRQAGALAGCAFVFPLVLSAANR